ncbi:hypothetical protein Dimus_017404 [Dionaea muscipula]
METWLCLILDFIEDYRPEEEQQQQQPEEVSYSSACGSIQQGHSLAVEWWLDLWHEKTCPVCRALVEEDRSSMELEEEEEELNEDMVLWFSCLLSL